MKFKKCIPGVSCSAHLTEAGHIVMGGELPMIFLLLMCSMLKNTYRGHRSVSVSEFSIVLYGINLSDFISNKKWAWRGFQLQVPLGQRLNARSQCLSLGSSDSPDQSTPKLWSHEVWPRNLIFYAQPGFLHWCNFIDWLQFFFCGEKKNRLKGEQDPGSECCGLGRSLSPTFFSQLSLRPLWTFYHQWEIYTHKQKQDLALWVMRLG